MTAGQNRRIDLFKISGKNNNLLQSLKLDKFPINCCEFILPHEIIASSNKPYFYVHDLEKNVGSFDYKIRGFKK